MTCDTPCENEKLVGLSRTRLSWAAAFEDEVSMVIVMMSPRETRNHANP